MNTILHNPFPGLRPFEFDENHLFFGREEQGSELLRKLGANHFVAAVGTSSSGKSSLVRAGLLPALYGGLMAVGGSGWRVALLRPGGDPFRNLAYALSDPCVLGATAPPDVEGIQVASAEAALRSTGLGLVELVRRSGMPPHENLLVVVDQFEELFRFRVTHEGRDDDAAAFVRRLLEASWQREVPIYVALTMRSDFLGDCAQFQG